MIGFFFKLSCLFHLLDLVVKISLALLTVCRYSFSDFFHHSYLQLLGIPFNERHYKKFLPIVVTDFVPPLPFH